MIYKQKILLIIIGFLLLTNIGMLVYFLNSTDKKPHDDNPPRQRFSETLKTTVGFSDEQIASFRSLRENHRESLRPVFDSIAMAKTNFYSKLTSGDSLDQKAIDSLLQPIGYYQLQLDRHVFNYFSRIRSLATPEQLPAMDSLIPAVVSKMVGYRKDRQGNNSSPAKK